MKDNQRILMAHGGGGQLMSDLLEDVILPALGNARLTTLSDAAYLEAPGTTLAFTTDTYVVTPLEFPGADIGRLAICGTINDLAVSGARPLALSLALVLEEGLELSTLRRLLESAGQAARQAGVPIVTGDTKVVERGRCDGMYINTAGVGVRLPAARLGYDRVRTGDAILLSGPLGDHGLTVLSQRKGLAFQSELRSDCAALHDICLALVERLGENMRFMRDLTRGGLAASLAELARGSRMDLEIDESAIPVTTVARSAAEILGLDVLTVANEGKLVVIVAPTAAEEALAVMRRFEPSRQACGVGRVCDANDQPLVELNTAYGGRRIVQMPYGEELPRIC